jgi:L-cysteine:1D-myo-inositol 2-amino-2-deoxy-alpha-D-glucopyranoside ligase
MLSWSAAEVPDLPGRSGLLRIYDTSARALVPLEPVDGTARLYVCGITPYDATHLGHAATYLAFDTLVRVWRDQGLAVAYAQNVTDIDDPLLERAARDGIDWQDLAARETELFREDMTALRVLPPTAYVGAVEAMPEIITAVERLADAGAAYGVANTDPATESGSEDLYFPVSHAPHFGTLAGLSETDMLALFAERGGDPGRAGKANPLDGLLWRSRRKDEPYWESPMGPGRPGWHVECTAIALRHLGERIDVQGGGSDLAFPHHEHSAACAEVLTGAWPFATANVHAGQIGLDGEKMSKSRGNLVFVSRLRAEGVDPAAVRLALLADHYRTDREWTGERLQAGQERLAVWTAAVRRPAGPSGSELLAQVRAALGEDLDTPTALAAVDAWAASEGTDEAAPALVRDVVDALLGVALSTAPEPAGRTDVLARALPEG